MKVQRRSTLRERQLRAEVQRILQLLERTRQTRYQVRLLIALERGVSRRKTGIKPGSARPGR